MFRICVCGKPGQENDMIINDAIIFEKLLFKNVLSPDENEKQAFSSFSGLKSVFKKRRFHDRLVRTVVLTIETKLRLLRGGRSLHHMRCHD